MQFDEDTQSIIDVVKKEKNITDGQAIYLLIEFGMLIMTAECCKNEEKRKLLNRISKTIRKDSALKRAAKTLHQTWTV